MEQTASHLLSDYEDFGDDVLEISHYVKVKSCPTRRARGRLDSHRQIGLFCGFGFCPFRGRVSSRQPPVTRAVETVEKVPFQILSIEKWDEPIEKHLVFGVLCNIFGGFQACCGRFFRNFFNQRVFRQSRWARELKGTLSNQ